MESYNVINGVICSTAKVEAETDRAISLTFSADIYGDMFVIKGQWFPKSMITIHKRCDGKIWFTAVNGWIIDRKCRDYCKHVAETFGNVKHEIRTYLSRMNNLVVEQVFA